MRICRPSDWIRARCQEQGGGAAGGGYVFVTSFTSAPEPPILWGMVPDRKTSMPPGLPEVNILIA